MSIANTANRLLLHTRSESRKSRVSSTWSIRTLVIQCHINLLAAPISSRLSTTQQERCGHIRSKLDLPRVACNGWKPARSKVEILNMEQWWRVPIRRICQNLPTMRHQTRDHNPILSRIERCCRLNESDNSGAIRHHDASCRTIEWFLLIDVQTDVQKYVWGLVR